MGKLYIIAACAMISLESKTKYHDKNTTYTANTDEKSYTNTTYTANTDEKSQQKTNYGKYIGYTVLAGVILGIGYIGRLLYVAVQNISYVYGFLSDPTSFPSELLLTLTGASNVLTSTIAHVDINNIRYNINKQGVIQCLQHIPEIMKNQDNMNLIMRLFSARSKSQLLGTVNDAIADKDYTSMLALLIYACNTNDLELLLNLLHK